MNSRKIYRIALTLAVVLGLTAMMTLSTHVTAADTTVFINEIHYDNSGTDANEGVEIAGPAGTNLSGWSLVLYNGNGGTSYHTENLNGTIPDLENGYGAIWFAIVGVQNGSPDGLALIDNSNNVVQFLSYEGTLTAVDGPANGMTSTDIGVSESGSTPLDESLQLSGSGTQYEDFTWTGPQTATHDAVNIGQAFLASTGLAISKSAPETVAPSEVFTYTLTVENTTGLTPTMTTITDVLPTDTAFITASQGGVIGAGNVISWTVSDFANGTTLTRTFQVTATGAHGTQIQNTDYGVNGGSDWLTTTTGTTVTTQIAGACDSIYNIQYPGGDSLCNGETITVTGVVYGVYGSDFAMAEASGAWHGIYVDNSTDTPALGDQIEIVGTVAENFGRTQIAYVTHTVMSTGTTPYAASVISTTEAASDEAYEGVLVEVQDVTVSDENPDAPDDYGEWEVDDGSNPVRVNDLSGYDPDPQLGDVFEVVRGMLNYSFGDYKIEPRDADDVVPFAGTGLVVSKDAPDFVAPGTLLTYTLTVNNRTGGMLTNLILSDTLPLSATYASATPMGNWDDATHTITWTAASLAHDTALSYTLVVTAPDEMTTLTNDQYVAYATEWPTPTTGAPATTLIRDCNSIYGIQYVSDPGTDDASPCAGQSVTVHGIVYATYGSGRYFIAEAAGPWHGLYVYNGGNVSVGDEVAVSGTLQEYYQLTEIYASGEEVLSSGNTPYGPSVVTAAEIPYQDAAASEAYESVFVETKGVTVTAAADSHGIWTFTDASGGEGKVDDWGYHLEPNVGDAYAIIRGALVYDWDEYKVLPRNADDVVEQQILLEKSAPANVSPGTLYTYTLTVENYTGQALDGVVLTDTVPASTTFAYAMDGGVLDGDVVSWTIGAMPYPDTFTTSFAVTATDESILVWNNNYRAGATNYPTPTLGSPVVTLIGDEISIHHIQGEGTTSPMVGQAVTGVDGIVTAVHDEGFYIQEPDPDANEMTSEGIYVYLNITPTVSVGDFVDVSGVVNEYYQRTEIDTSLSSVSVVSTGNTIPATQVTLPEQTDGELERYEGMLVTLPHTMTVAQNYFQGRYGQVTLSTGERMYQPTHMHEPGSQEAIDLADENMRRMLILDDGSSEQNPFPIPYIGANNTLRAGDVVSANLTGIIDNGPINSNTPPTVDYRLHPTGAVDIERVNTRPLAPADVGGRLQVASFNVLNYFNGDGMGGGFPTARGADTPEEFERQRDKIITAVLALDADVVGLMEIENDGYDANSAIADLVDGLNSVAGAATYAYVDPGVNKIGEDEIAVGMIYRPAVVTPVGSAAILDNSFDPDYIDDKNRPALAQTFAENATGERFTAVVNHLKSKGSSCADIGDPATGDGQGNCNLTRTSAMSVEVSWLATDPTGSGDPDFIILGDLNSYAQEDPIDVARNAGYTDLLWQYVGSDAYSYVFDGESGYLDYGMSNENLTAQVTGATIWHINADEPSVIDYNTEHKSQDFYTPSAYRASDHDPVIVGLDLASPDLSLTKDVEPVMNVGLGNILTYTLTLSNSGQMEATGVQMTDTLPLSVTFGGFIIANGATEENGEITLSDTVGIESAIDVIYTATVAMDTTLYGETLTNTATYASDNAGSGQAQAAFTVIGPPALELSKSVTPEVDVDLGDVVTYTLTLTNSGAATAYGVILTDTLPSDLVGANFTWTGDLPPDEGLDFVYTATVAMNYALYGETLTNTATYDSDNAGSGQAQATFTIIGPPNLNTSAKVSSSAGQQVMPGDLVTYTVTLSNTSDVATTVMLTDTLGSYYTVVNALDFTEPISDTLTWKDTISAGSERTLHFVAQVVPLADLDVGTTTLVNRVTIDDNINPPFDIDDQMPPYVEIEGLYLPLIARNSN